LTGGAGTGHAQLIVSAPPLAPRSVTVTLSPSFLVNPYTAPVQVLNGSSTSLSFPTATVNPDSGAVIYQQQRADIDPGVSYDVDRPDIVQARDIYSATYRPSEGVSLRAVAAGTANLTITSGLFPLRGSSGVQVNVVQSTPLVVTLTDQVVGRQLQTLLLMSVTPGNPSSVSPTQIRLTSEDSSRVLLSTSAGALGAASVTVAYTPGGNPQLPSVWIQGRSDSGVVRIRADVDGAPSVYANIALAPGRVGFINFLPQTFGIPTTLSIADFVPQSVSVNPWSNAFALYIAFTVKSPIPPGFAIGTQWSGPDDFQYNLVSSNPGVVPSLINYHATGAFNIGVNITQLQPGTTQLSLDQSLYDAGPPAQVTVNASSLPLAVSELTVGKDLVTYIPFNTPYGFPKSNVTVTTADPTRVTVGAYGGDTQTSITVGTNAGIAYGTGDGFWVTALTAGDVSVTLSVPNYPARVILVHVVPIVYRLNPPALTASTGDPVRVYVSISYPGMGSGYTLFSVRDAARPTFAVTVSDSSVLRVNAATFSFNGGGYPDVTAMAAGTATIQLTSSSGAAIDPQYTTSTVTVIPKTFTMPEPVIVLGKDLQRSLFSASYPLAYPQNKTFRSADPASLLLSRDPQTAGVAQLDDTGPIYLQALTDSGETKLITSAPGFADATVRVLFVPSALGFFEQKVAGTAGTNTTLHIDPRLIDPVSGNPIAIQGFSLRGGLDPVNVSIATSDPTVGRIFSPIGFTAGMAENTTQFSADANGTTELSIGAAGSFIDGGEALHAHISIGAPKLSLADISLGKDIMYYHQVLGVGYQTSNFSFTVTSSDPSRVIVSASPKVAGQASAMVSGSTIFYVQALADNGDVTLTVTAAGYDSVTATVHLEPSYFAFGQVIGANSDFENYMTNFSKQVYLIHPSYSYPSNEFLRPGAGPITIPVTSSDPTIVSVNGPVIMQDGSNYASVSLTALATGKTTVVAGAPPGYIVGPDSDRSETITVAPRQFNFSYADISKDRVGTIGTFGALNYAANVTVTSADPSRVLLSTDPKKVGTAQVTFAADPKNSTTVYAQALSDTGSPAFTVTAPGFQDYSGAVRLHPSGFMYPNFASPLALKVGSTATVQILTDSLQALRPGLSPVTLRVSNSNSAVATASTVTFQPGDTSQYMTITAKSAGTTVFTLLDSSGIISNTVLVVNISGN
jgi:hypothetical protein